MVDVMAFYYPIPAGATVTCMHCGGLLSRHLDERGGWRGCVIDGSVPAEVDGAMPVFLVTDRRREGDRRRVEAEFAASAVVGAAPLVHAGEVHELVRGPQERRGQPVVQQQPPQPMVAGPRGAVYVAAPGTRFSGSGKTAQVFEAIAGAGQQGKSGAELRKELKVKPKSLESMLYRLRLAGLIRSFNANDVRRG